MKSSLIWKLVVFVIVIFVVGGIYFQNVNLTFLGVSNRHPMKKIEILFFEDHSLPYIRYSFLSLKGGVDFTALEKSGLSALTGYLLNQGAGGLSSEEIQE